MLFQIESDTITSLINLTMETPKAAYISVVAREKGPPNQKIERIDMWSILKNRQPLSAHHCPMCWSWQ
jgi:hypothetical protein